MHNDLPCNRACNVAHLCSATAYFWKVKRSSSSLLSYSFPCWHCHSVNPFWPCYWIIGLSPVHLIHACSDSYSSYCGVRMVEKRITEKVVGFFSTVMAEKCSLPYVLFLNSSLTDYKWIYRCRDKCQWDKSCDYLSGTNNAGTISTVKILHYWFMYKHELKKQQQHVQS